MAETTKDLTIASPGCDLSIPDFTAEDYTDGEAPYAWLYGFRTNKFLLLRLKEKMKKHAGSLGVKSFLTLFNAYCEYQASQSGDPIDRVTEFDGQPIVLVSGEYICSDTGVSVLDKFGYESTVCSHPIMPTKRLVNVDTGEERMEISYKKGLEWRSVIVEKAVIASSQKILDLAAYGVIVNSENAKALSTYLFKIEQLNYSTIPEQRSVGRLGWIGNHGFAPYIEDIEFDGEANYRGIFSAVEQHGDRNKWIEAIKAVRAEHTVGRILIAASFASALLEPCGLLPFFVHAWGGQGMGKTVSVMLAASVWANPRMGEYISTFNSTNTGQEMVASFLNNLPLCIDELQIQASAKVKDFDNMIYKLTEGIGKTRGAKAGGIQKVLTWRNCILTTGEYPIINPNSMGGASVRVIECEYDRPVYSDQVSLVATINENYGFAGREFVEYLQTGDNLEKVKEIQKSIYKSLLNEDNTAKQAASVSALIAADKIATELFFRDDNELTLEELQRYMIHTDSANANARALEYIYELISRNPTHFTASEYGDYKTEVWGKIDAGCVYIIRSVFEREMSIGGFNATSFLAWADRQGLLITDPKYGGTSSRKTRKARIAGTAVNTVCLLLENAESVENTGIDELPF